MRPKSSCTFSAAPSSAAAVPTRCGSKYEEGAARVDAPLHVRASPELRAGVIRGPYSYEYKAHPAAGDDRVRLVQSDGSADLSTSNNRHPSPLSRAASLRSPISPTSTMRRVGWACCMIAMTCRCWCARVRKLPRALSLGCRCRWWTGGASRRPSGSVCALGVAQRRRRGRGYPHDDRRSAERKKIPTRSTFKNARKKPPCI